MNSSLAQENAASSGKHAALLRWLPVLLIVAVAAIYYGSYLRYWFNPHDEGGTVCLIAQRLMQGERPWVDVDLGYNVGWFYPVVGLFHLTGVNYLAARAFFFALSAITALLGYGVVKRVSGSRWLGVAVALVLVVLPGSQFKNYIPLAEMANTACLIQLLYVPFSARRKWCGALVLGGAVLGLTALVRVELAIFFAVIWTILLLLLLLDQRLALAQRGRQLLLSVALLAAVVLAVQVPPYLYLRSLGVEAHFTAQVPNWLQTLRTGLDDQIGAAQKPPPVLAPAPAAESVPAVSAKLAAVADRSTLARRPLADIWHHVGRKNRFLAFLTYAPFVGFVLVLLVGFALFLRSVARREFTLEALPVKLLLLVGGSLTTFPQFFFFRPDRPHLSEFMPGYILAMTGCVALLWPRGETRGVWQSTLAFACTAYLSVHLCVYAHYAFQHPSAGTIAARFGRETKFTGDNGIRVRDFKRQATTFTTIRDTVLAHAKPEDFVVCFPYNPGFNLMTNRRTFMRNVYVDNATHDADWMPTTIRDFEAKQPAVVIIDNRAINGTPASRFTRWAAPVYDYVKIHYARVAEIKSKDESIEVFAKSFDPIAP